MPSVYTQINLFLLLFACLVLLILPTQAQETENFDLITDIEYHVVKIERLTRLINQKLSTDILIEDDCPKKIRSKYATRLKYNLLPKITQQILVKNSDRESFSERDRLEQSHLAQKIKQIVELIESNNCLDLCNELMLMSDRLTGFLLEYNHSCCCS